MSLATKNVVTVLVGLGLVMGLAFAFATPMSYTHSNTIEQAKESGMYNCLVGYARKTGNPRAAIAYCDSLSPEELKKVSVQVWEEYIARGWPLPVSPTTTVTAPTEEGLYDYNVGTGKFTPHKQ